MKRRNFLKRLGIGAVSTVVVSAVSVDAPVLAEPVKPVVTGGTLWAEGGNLYYRKNEGVVNTILDGQKYWHNTTDILSTKFPRYYDKEL